VITTEFYDGQGLGNQLWVYAVCRTIALDRGLDYGIQSPERFKGRAFMNLDFGLPVLGENHDGPSPELPLGIRHYYAERKLQHPSTGDDISPYDANLVAVCDSTKIDGTMQSESYIYHRKAEFQELLQVTTPAEVSEDECIISFRGGEYKYHPELMLGVAYYQQAMKYMGQFFPGVTFRVVTDDPRLARQYFPGLRISSGRRFVPPTGLGIRPSSSAIGRDFSLLQGATKLILSNSTFSWWGAWSNSHSPTVIAPQFWARHNISDGYWAQGDSLTREWWWVSPKGDLLTHESCRRQLEDFRHSNQGFE